MNRIVLVGAAGALGTLARYGIAVWAAGTLGAAFPFGTLLVNVIGCFLIALIASLAASTTMVPPTLRLTLATGFCGGLTTYSSFNLETTNLLRQGHFAMGFANVVVTLSGCFFAGLAGVVVATLAAARADGTQRSAAPKKQADLPRDHPHRVENSNDWVPGEQGEP